MTIVATDDCLHCHLPPKLNWGMDKQWVQTKLKQASNKGHFVSLFLSGLFLLFYFHGSTGILPFSFFLLLLFLFSSLPWEQGCSRWCWFGEKRTKKESQRQRMSATSYDFIFSLLSFSSSSCTSKLFLLRLHRHINSWERENAFVLSVHWI